MNKEIYNLIPQTIKDLLFQSEGWLVGSAIQKLLDEEEIGDFDILITDLKLYYKIISSNKNNFVKFTSFGGIKIEVDNIIIDIWHQNLDDFIINSSSTGIMYNLKHYKTLKLN